MAIERLEDAGAMAEADMGALPGVILAGGAARRMGGGDKGARPIGGMRMIDRVLARLAPQAGPLAISANGDPARFADLHLPVLPDSAGGAGPLAGVLAGLDWAAGQGAGQIVTVPVDTPFLPCDLVARLCEAGAGLALAEAGGRLHPVCGLWPVAARDRLRAALADGVRKVACWAETEGAVRVRFDEAGAFFNVNTPEDLARAERLL